MAKNRKVTGKRAATKASENDGWQINGQGVEDRGGKCPVPTKVADQADQRASRVGGLEDDAGWPYEQVLQVGGGERLSSNAIEKGQEVASSLGRNTPDTMAHQELT